MGENVLSEVRDLFYLFATGWSNMLYSGLFLSEKADNALKERSTCTSQILIADLLMIHADL
jgi:hypothetical protein